VIVVWDSRGVNFPNMKAGGLGYGEMPHQGFETLSSALNTIISEHLAVFSRNVSSPLAIGFKVVFG